MSLVVLDFETHLGAGRDGDGQPGIFAPPIVCGAFYDGGQPPLLGLREDALHATRLILERRAVLSNAHLAFDMACYLAARPEDTDLVFDKYERGEVYDVLIGQMLDAIARGLLRDEQGNRVILDPRTGAPIKDPKTGKLSKRYSLSIVTDLCLGRVDAKRNDRWRKSYALLENVPLGLWPEDAVQYPKDDAVNAYDVTMWQKANLKNLHNIVEQCRASLVLQLASVWGLRTNGDRVDAVRKRVAHEYEKAIETFRDSGIYKFDEKEGWKEDGRALKRRVIAAYGGGAACAVCGGVARVRSAVSGNEVWCVECDGTGIDAPTAVRNEPSKKFPKGSVKADRDTLAESGDDVLEAYAKYGPNDKLRETYVPFVEQGVKYPINLSPNVLVGTGRASYDGLIQLLPREGGIRECFEARPGYVYCSVDYAAVEISTLAQVCLWTVGRSALAEAVNADKDVHALFGAEGLLNDTTYDEFVATLKDENHPRFKFIKNTRQESKEGNFGFGGMMGPVKFTISARKKGLRFCIKAGLAEKCGVEKIYEWKGRPCPPVCKACVERVAFIREKWLRQWPEMPRYFDWITHQLETNDNTLTQFVSKRIRGGLSGPSGANTLFQGLAADGAKRALWSVAKDCYTNRQSPLYGGRIVVFAHDEIITELPEAQAHEAGYRQAELMVAAMRTCTPDVKVKAEPALMKFWYKGAETVKDANGRLIPWEPKEKKAA